nr:hypothetical protein GCM10020093_049140 [Planobispora longispora]
MRLSMWVNGERVHSVLDENPLPTGEVGMIVRVEEKSGAVLKTSYDNFTMHGPAGVKKQP